MFIKNGQFGVACVAGIERVVHSTRRVCGGEHLWSRGAGLCARAP